MKTSELAANRLLSASRARIRVTPADGITYRTCMLAVAAWNIGDKFMTESGAICSRLSYRTTDPVEIILDHRSVLVRGGSNVRPK